MNIKLLREKTPPHKPLSPIAKDPFIQIIHLVSQEQLAGQVNLSAANELGAL